MNFGLLIPNNFYFRSSLGIFYRLAQNRVITIEGEIPDPPLSFANQNDRQPAAPPSLALWDDLCVYGNDLLDAMNELRSGLSPMQVLFFRFHANFVKLHKSKSYDHDETISGQ